MPIFIEQFNSRRPTTRHHRAGYPNGMPAQITSADDSFIFNRRRGSHALNAW